MFPCNPDGRYILGDFVMFLTEVRKLQQPPPPCQIELISNIMNKSPYRRGGGVEIFIENFTAFGFMLYCRSTIINKCASLSIQSYTEIKIYIMFNVY